MCRFHGQTPSCPHSLPRFWLGWLIVLIGLAQLSAQTVPSGGQALVSGDLAVDGSFYGGSVAGGPVAVRTVVDVAAPGFTRASRIDVQRPTGDAWSSALYGPSSLALANNDVVLVRFFLRAVQTTDESGTVSLELYAEGPGPSFTRSHSQQASAGPEWTEYLVPFAINGDFAAGQFRINFGFGAGDRPQVLELGGVEVWWYGKTRTLAEMPRTRFNYEGRDANAAWRAAAAARIDQYRKSDYAIRVVDETGQPLPGARVRVRLRRHAFPFGTAFQASRVAGAGDPTNQTYRTKLLELFNAGSTENDLKWPPWEGDWGNAFNRAQTLAALAWLQDRGMHLRGHVLVWPSRRNLPNSITALSASDPSIPQRVRNHIADIITATKPYVNEWDVLNEPYDNKDLMEAFGNEIMVDWFKTAREHLPTGELYINDYGILSGGGLHTAHQNHYEETIRFLLQQGAPVTGIGMQGHFGASPTGMTKVWSLLERYAQAFPGLGIKITEFDVDTDDEELQADYTRDFLTLLFSHPAVKGFQVWGFWEGAHWRAKAAMYRMDWTEKPNGRAFRELVHEQWRTDDTQTTGADGAVFGRGFRGDYEVTVTAPGRAATTSVTLGAAALEAAVVAPVVANRSRLVNIATRGPVGTGANVMIAGFVLRGPGEKDVVIRGIGPRLQDFGVTGVLADPRLALYRGEEQPAVATNDDWDPGLATNFGEVGAFPLDGDVRSAALRASLREGGYSVHLSGAADGTGVGLVEVYDAATAAPIEVVNLATRGMVGAGSNVMIGGFAIRGEGSKRVLIRGVGPGLEPYLTGFVVNPNLVLYEMPAGAAAREIGRNDDWGTDGDAAEIAATSVSVGAFPLVAGSRDAVLLRMLEPGNYSVHLAGATGATGVGLIEVYAVE